jgi:hypothetical protein
MRELIETIRCANLLPMLLIEGKKDAHLGASLKIFPIHQENTRNSPDVLFARCFNIGCQMFYICQMS